MKDPECSPSKHLQEVKMRSERRMQNQRESGRAKEDFRRARRAVEDFRIGGDAGEFPALRSWLRFNVWAGERRESSRYTLSAFGERDLGLTSEEYDKMEQAYNEMK